MTLKRRKQAIFSLGISQNSLITGAAGPARNLGLAAGQKYHSSHDVSLSYNKMPFN